MRNAKRHKHTSVEDEYLKWYEGTRPRLFDPTPFVHAARQQWADRPALVYALAFCTRQWPVNDPYTHLFDPSLKNREGEKWRSAGCRQLDVRGIGEVLVDLKSNIADPTRFVIGGIEFLDRVLGKPAHLRKGFLLSTATEGLQELPPPPMHLRVVWVK